MTPEQFDAALSELQWKAADFTRKAGLVPNTAWRWRKGLSPIPAWVPEYLGAILEIQRLHARYAAVRKHVEPTSTESTPGTSDSAEV